MRSSWFANEGLQAVNGEWFCFLDDDDTYDFNFLSALLSVSHAHPETLLIYGRTRVFDENVKVEKLFGSPFNRALIRGYTLRGMRSPNNQVVETDAGRITIFDAEVQMITLANEIDMYLSGETRYSPPRNDEMTPAQLDVAAKICEIIGVSGMSHSLQQGHNDKRLPPPLSLLTQQKMSYQLNQEHSAITPRLTTSNSCPSE